MPWPFPLRTPEAELWKIIDRQSQLIHQLQEALAALTGSHPPAPYPLLSRPPSSSSPKGTEAISVNTKERRREQDLKEALLHTEPFLPPHMRNPRPIPGEQQGAGKGASGGWAATTTGTPSTRSPSPPPGPPSGSDSSSKPPS